MSSKLSFILSAAALSLLCAGAHGHSDVKLPGQKLDSGLGELPHYSTWVDRTGRTADDVRVIGESLDSGLGELPHYSKWVDPTGRDPLGLERRMLSAARR